MSDHCFKLQFTTFRSRLEQGLPRSMAWSQNKLVVVGVDVYVLDPSCASPLKHHATGRQWCTSQPRPLSWLWTGQSVSNSFLLSANKDAKQSSRTSNFNVFLFDATGDRHPPPPLPPPHARRTLAQPLHWSRILLFHIYIWSQFEYCSLVLHFCSRDKTKK